MSEDVFYVPDVLADLAAIRAILRHRAQRIQEAGGDPTVTLTHLEALDKLERFLCGECSLIQLQRRLVDYTANGRRRAHRAEVFKLMCED